SDILCSKSRPLHFRGVTTIVSKLLNIIRPHIMVIGQKDAQQTALLQQMATDLNIDTEIIAAPIIREKDGLAMSSRNVYLKTNEREKALILSKSLKNIKNSLLSGKTELNSALNDARKIIEGTHGIRLDYLEAHTWPSLEPVKNLNGKILIAGAIFLANVRLIDNIIVGQE
ncbi:MAG: pantoate--beta-alanine ligase, partial [Candidatus Marinimicrobia bacterium]|nr:pantoate--beta-alanine ligase [Candidatus Neomarinimicrobiota bacterium]